MSKWTRIVLSLSRRNLFFVLVFSVHSACHAPAQSSAPLHLIPQPRVVAAASTQTQTLKSGIHIIAANAEDAFAAKDLAETLEARGIRKSEHAHTIELLRFDTERSRKLLADSKLTFDPAMQAEGYAIVPAAKGLTVIAATAEGLFYGAQTVKQMITGNGPTATLHAATIRDWPAMRYRGMDDDLSRGPVPTLEFQKKQIRTFAAYKLNVYSPYFENTFRYESNPVSASPGGAMTHAEYSELVQYAQQYHVTVLPEQEAIGHLHNVLTYEQYADLAETPHGTVLAPGNPAVLPLIQQWFTELAAVTPGPFMHIGGDETSDLGKGKTHDAVKQRGLGPVYIDFLKQIAQELKPLNKRILFWGDVAVNEPKLVPGLPKEMIAVPWDYDLNPKGYEQEILPFKQAGMETWIAPGVNNWNRVYPDNNVSLRNIQGFIRDGQHLGSTGALTTAWNDDGEGLFNQDWYGVLFAAAASWQPGESSIEAFQQSYGEVFHGDSTATSNSDGYVDLAQKELMAAHALLSPLDERGASDALFWVDPWSADGQAIAPKINPKLHELRLHAERTLMLLAKAQAAAPLRETDALFGMELGARRIDLIGMKFQLSNEIIDAYGRALKAKQSATNPDEVDSALYEISDTNGRCQDIRNAYAIARDQYEEAWLRENRPYWLHNVLTRYDLAMQLWARRGDSVAAALNQWHRDHTLPDAAALGIPTSHP